MLMLSLGMHGVTGFCGGHYGPIPNNRPSAISLRSHAKRRADFVWLVIRCQPLQHLQYVMVCIGIGIGIDIGIGIGSGIGMYVYVLCMRISFCMIKMVSLNFKSVPDIRFAQALDLAVLMADNNRMDAKLDWLCHLVEVVFRS